MQGIQIKSVAKKNRSATSGTTSGGIRIDATTGPSLEVADSDSETIEDESTSAYSEILLRTIDLRNLIAGLKDVLEPLGVRHLFVFMDDFMRFTNGAPGKTRAALEAEHLDLLDAFLSKVEDAKLKLKLPKAQHALEEMEAIGMVYGHGQMWKTDWTTQVVREYPPPKGQSRWSGFWPSATTTHSLWTTLQAACRACEYWRARNGGVAEIS